MSSALQEQEATPDESQLRLEELRRITSSQSFAKAPRLCSFLSYIVEKSIEGDHDSLTEQQIGIYVFRRSPGYNSNDDNIVRGTARSLRQRLATYYLTEGLGDAIRIEIPKGAYVAQFLEVAAPEAGAGSLEEAHGELHDAHPVGFAGTAKRSRWPMILAVVVVLGLACEAVWPMAHQHWVMTHTPGAPLWNTLFTPDRPTIIVPGDAGLNMYEVLQKQVVNLNDYTQQDYQDTPAARGTLAEALGTRFYTTMSDLQLVSRLVRLPQTAKTHVDVRFARDVAPTDLRDANLILMGTQSYNPWVQLFQNGPTLKMSWNVDQDMFTVTNLAPKKGEQREYQWTIKNGVQGGLTLVSLASNTQGTGRVLLIEGTTMVGVFAGADFLEDPQLLNPVLRQARRPDGSLRNFDVLLQSDFIREGVSNLHVLAVHIR